MNTDLSFFLFGLSRFEFLLYFFYQTKRCVQIERWWLRGAMGLTVRASIITV